MKSARRTTRRAGHPGPQTRATIRAWDRRAIEEFAVPGVVLMENAGAGAARVILSLARARRAPVRGPFSIFCGPGKNGGDGFVVARHLHNHGQAVHIVIVGGTEHPRGSDAGIQLEIVRRMKLPIERVEEAPEEALRSRFDCRTVVDGLFGTGLSRPLGPPFAAWIEAINRSGRSVVALDVPSGLDADTGEVLGAAIEADHTITFLAPKIGFERGAGPRLAGTVHVVDIGLPREIWEPRVMARSAAGNRPARQDRGEARRC